VSTEFRQHGIPYIFFTSVYSVCHTEVPKIPRNYTEFRVTECGRIPQNSAEFRGIPRNFALHGILHDWVVTNRSSKKAVKRTLTRGETKIFVFIFSRKFIFAFCEKSYENNEHFRENFRENWCENFCENENWSENFRENENWSENFGKNENFYEHLRKNLTFWYNHILTRLFHNFFAEIFATIFSKTNFDAKMFAKTKIFAKNFANTKIFSKRNFAKITSFSHDFRFSRKWKTPFSFQP
jgi:hypothetical protein